MRAYAIDSLRAPGSIRDVPVPEPAEGEPPDPCPGRRGERPSATSRCWRGSCRATSSIGLPARPRAGGRGRRRASRPGRRGVQAGRRGRGEATRGRSSGRAPSRRWRSCRPGSVRRIWSQPASRSISDEVALPGCPPPGRWACCADHPERMDPQPGRTTVLLVGATGGVGSFATQLISRPAGAALVALNRPEIPVDACCPRPMGASAVLATITAPDLSARADPDRVPGRIRRDRRPVGRPGAGRSAHGPRQARLRGPGRLDRHGRRSRGVRRAEAWSA